MSLKGYKTYSQWCSQRNQHYKESSKKVYNLAKKAYNLAKKAYNKVKIHVTLFFPRKLQNVRRAFDWVKRAFKTGLRILKYMILEG